MKKYIFIILAVMVTASLGATTKSYYAYVPTYMSSLGTMTISINYSTVDIKCKNEQMRCEMLNKLTTNEGTVYLLKKQKTESFWILAVSATDGALFESNSSFSVRNMKAYLSTTRIDR